MSKIHVNLVDMAGYQSSLPLPNDKSLHSLIPAIITLLDLPEGHDYRLFSTRTHRVLSLNGTLYSNGVLPTDTLRVVPSPASVVLELELLDEPSPGARLPLPNQTHITIGRGSENDIVIRHAAVSRQHGELIWQDGIHIYRDLNSANGSYINNQVVSEPMPISPGSILSLGENIRLVYQEIEPIEVDETDEAEILSGIAPDSGMTTTLNPLPRGLVFVSYPQTQLPLVKKLINLLREVNFHIFWDEEIPPGSNAATAIANALQVADMMLVILTPDAIETPSLIDQWHEFVLTRKKIIPVIYTPCEIPKIFANDPVIKFEGDFNRLNNEIVAALLQASL